MKLICDYCGGYLTDLDENCPNCGAPNPNYQRQAPRVPRTIAELKQWYIDHNLPPQEVTRFFIGENYKGPKAFGIYQDGERFIVYKNKDDGSRAIRYDGSDEAYAVNELYLKLKERIAEQKAGSVSRRPAKKKRRGVLSTMILVYGVILVFSCCVGIVTNQLGKKRGYYTYDNRQYYYLDDWYVYDTYTGDWVSTYVDDELSKNYKDYYETSYYDEAYGTSDFEDTSYYSSWEESHSGSSSDSDWDSDSSWSNSDSWDSDSGDWSSDW